jgi:hypothetical protein
MHESVQRASVHGAQPARPRRLPRGRNGDGGASRLARTPVRSSGRYAQGAAAVQLLITPVVKLMALLLWGVPTAARQAPSAMFALPTQL